jgi:hypothetical protein
MKQTASSAESIRPLKTPPSTGVRRSVSRLAPVRICRRYKSDAYHSLSIEGYSVTPALIERVQRGDWDPDHHDDDRVSRDALAARGYWQTFQKVKETVGEVIASGNAGALVRTAHKELHCSIAT